MYVCTHKLFLIKIMYLCTYLSNTLNAYIYMYILTEFCCARMCLEPHTYIEILMQNYIIWYVCTIVRTYVLNILCTNSAYILRMYKIASLHICSMCIRDATTRVNATLRIAFVCIAIYCHIAICIMTRFGKRTYHVF